MVDNFINQNIDAIINRIENHDFSTGNENVTLFPIIASIETSNTKNDSCLLFNIADSFTQNNDTTYSHVEKVRFVNDDRVNISAAHVDLFGYVPYFPTTKNISVRYIINYAKKDHTAIDTDLEYDKTHKVTAGEILHLGNCLKDKDDAYWLVGCEIHVKLLDSQYDSLMSWLSPVNLFQRTCVKGIEPTYGVINPLHHIQPSSVTCDLYHKQICEQDDAHEFDQKCSCFNSQIHQYHQTVQTSLNQGPCSDMTCIQGGFRSFHNSRSQCNHMLCQQSVANWSEGSDVTMNCNGYYYAPASRSDKTPGTAVNMIIQERYNAITMPVLVVGGVAVLILLTVLTHSSTLKRKKPKTKSVSNSIPDSTSKSTSPNAVSLEL
jgi:hypothetical protein